MATQEQNTSYITGYYAGLIGKTVREVRPLFPEEIEDLGWESGDHTVAFAVIFTDGSFIIPMRDDEGNGAGTLIFENTK
jgi:hypothetical protein